MNIYSRPVLFAIAAAALVSVGTLITTIIPIFMPSTQPVSKYIKPYTAIELEGRDIYIREGCNNCHSQTVRPLLTEVARYGEYSKPEESAYDRPFLWGSKRTGPDLARVGGKYPDSWHYQHMVDPQSMFEKSNMPPFKWLPEKKLNTKYSLRKVSILGFGYSDQEVTGQIDDFGKKITSSTYPSKEARDRVTPENLKGEITELDALVAYLQKLGRDVKELKKREKPEVKVAASKLLTNPFKGDEKAAEEGADMFTAKCAACHGERGEGKICPDLTDEEWIYGSSDDDIFRTISGGRAGGMPPFANQLGEENIWKIISFIRKLGK